MNDTTVAKHRIRLLQLLEASERAALAPIGTDKLHSFAYLSDVLSQVWGLAPFDNRILKTGRSPFYPDLQRELDALVAMGLVEVTNLSYRRLPDQSLAFYARYALNFHSAHCNGLRTALATDPDALLTQSYLDELAQALASLRDEDISGAATEDATYHDPKVERGDVIYFNDPRSLRTTLATEAFREVFPEVELSPSQRLYMYAHYLGQKVHAAG
ncbi:hypothetical protein FJ951_17545 [Mesorhizobium sp. B2-2-3]|uniref:hypothetical protein n=1 Tax=Mesorhizobium sp. B2-2-3 TaxID=2589963 RepID=UPI00112B402B|nr:hypothetical protein [Mesorhizobium sp. B2-2-3]TPM45634.1 hypothetical protein FJ951_17545 [Mesorhizobium sp. B2-2-3]